MKVAIASAPESRLNSSNLPLSLTTVLGFDNSFDNNADGRPWTRGGRFGEYNYRCACIAQLVEQLTLNQ